MNNKILMVALAASLLAACSDDKENGTPIFDAGRLPGDGAVSTPDASSTDAGSLADAWVTPSAADCFPASKTYLELINACTDAEKVDKTPVLPLLGADGGLPPLP